MADLTGTRIGPYRVDGVIGAGGFATVYRAVDERLRSDVAIKVLAENHALDPEIRERFINEGHVLRRADGPGVLTVYDVGETRSGAPYLVLELGDLGDLARRRAHLVQGGWSPSGDDLRVVADALRTSLSRLHAAGVVHRDVTPRNLLIRSTTTGDGPGSELVGSGERLMLGDLGLAKDLAARSGLTVGGGTSGFAAPEQLRPGVVVDERADVHGASACLIWLLTGEAPDAEGEWRQTLAPSSHPPALLDALERGVAADPSDRYSSIAAWHVEVIEALRPVAAPSPPPDRPRRRLRPRLVVALVLFVLVVGVAFASTRGGSDRPVTIDLGDGRVRVTSTAGNSSLSLVGPSVAPVGRVEVEVEAVGIDRWIVTSPSGDRFTDVDGIAVTASTPGSAQVVVEGATADGEELTTRLEIEFTR